MSREPTNQLQNATGTNPRQEPDEEWEEFISLNTLFDFGMVEKKDKRLSPVRLGAPRTVLRRALFLAFLVHRRFAPCRWRGTQLVLLAGCITGTSALQKVIGRTMQLALKIGVFVDAGCCGTSWVFPRAL